MERAAQSVPASRRPARRAPAVPRLAVAAAALASAALAVWALAGWRGDLPARPIDFRVYYVAALVWAHGGDPYPMSKAAWFAFGHAHGLGDFVWPYRYPPYTAALLRPLLPLGEPAVLALWQGASVAAMVASAWLLARTLGGGRLYVAAFLLLLALAPAYDTLLVGQINGFVLLSLAVALWALRRPEPGLGVSLAAGAALKLVPAALIAYLALRRRWRPVLWSLAALALFSGLAAALLGAHAFGGYAAWALDMVRPESVMNGPTNATLVGAMGRLLPRDLQAARLIGRVLALAALAVTAWLCLPRRDRPHDQVLAFATVVAVLPLLPPFTWFHQLLLLLPALLIAGQRLWARGRRAELALLAALLAAADAMWVFIDPGYWLGLRVPYVYYRLSFPTLLCLALWLLCAHELWRGHPPSAHTSTQSRITDNAALNRARGSASRS